MEMHCTDLLAIAFVALCVYPVATLNSTSVSVSTSTTWTKRTSATKRKIVVPEEGHIDTKNFVLIKSGNTSTLSCPLERGVLELGKSILLDDCGRLECVEQETGLIALVEIRCRPSNEILSPECRWTQKAKLKFPDCCAVALTCEQNIKPSLQNELKTHNSFQKSSQPVDMESSSSVEYPLKSNLGEAMISVAEISANSRGNKTFQDHLTENEKMETTEKKEDKTLGDEKGDTSEIKTIAKSTSARVFDKKFPLVKSRGYDFKRFIERTKSNLKAQSSVEQKPSFFLSTRGRVKLKETSDTPQLKKEMFVMPTNTSEKSEVPANSEGRRRLSSLLSSQRFRGRLGDRLVPIIAATSEQQKSFVLSNTSPNQETEKVDKNVSTNNVTLKAKPVLLRSRKPHWNLNQNGTIQNAGPFGRRRKFFPNLISKFVNRKHVKNDDGKDKGLVANETEIILQTTPETKDVPKTEELISAVNVSGKEDTIQNAKTFEIEKESKTTNEEEIKDIDVHQKTEGNNDMANTRERLKLRRIKMRRKSMPLTNVGDVREKRLLDIQSYEPKRKNVTDGEAGIALGKLTSTMSPEMNSSLKTEHEDPSLILQRRKLNTRQKLFLHINPTNRTKSEESEDAKISEKQDLKKEPTVESVANQTAVEIGSRNKSRAFNKISIPVFSIKDIAKARNKIASQRGRLIFDLSKHRSLKDPTKASESIASKITSRGRSLLVRPNNRAREAEKTSENDIAQTNVTDVTSVIYPEETEEEDEILVEEPPPGYDPLTDPDYPKFTPIRSSLEDFDKHYPLPDEENHKRFYDMDLSSSDSDISKLLGQEENEIHDENTKIPMKVTTVLISQSQKSYRSSMTRNTAKNFKETPEYESKTFYKNVKKPAT